ncbi:MAG: hypothetical protein RR959_08285 [Erysipelotrichaceae bacterium]
MKTDIDQVTRTKLVENTLFSINTLGQDINTIVYVVNGIKIKATELLQLKGV